MNIRGGQKTLGLRFEQVLRDSLVYLLQDLVLLSRSKWDNGFTLSA